MNVSVASTSEEYEGVVELFAKNFPLNYYQHKRNVEFFFGNSPRVHTLIVKDSNKNVVGALCLLDRVLNYCGIGCPLTGTSYLAVDPEHQNTSVIEIIKAAMFDHLDKNSYLGIGFARKVMDNYWYQYGFRGFTNFCQISFPLCKLPKVKPSLITRKAEESHLPSISDIYHETYLESIGSLIRDLPLWSYYKKQSRRNAGVIEVLYEGDEVIGYLVTRENIVLEAGVKELFSREVIGHIGNRMRDKGYKEVIFEIGQYHPLFIALSRYEHSISTRFVWKGGHIVRISSVFRLLLRIRKKLEQRLHNANVNSFEFVCNTIRFVFSNGELKIDENVNKDPEILFKESEWSLLILGVIEPQFLLGFKGERHQNILSIMFPKAHPQVPWLDQL